jgi:hypothetical protein
VTPANATTASTTYPAIMGSIDLARAVLGAKTERPLQSVLLHGGWSKAGNAITSAGLQRLDVNSSSALIRQTSVPEVTTGTEGGLTLQALSGRLLADVTAYDDRSEQVFIPDATLNRTGVITNHGYELTATVIPVRTKAGFEWALGANLAQNTNQVESLSGGAASVSLAPAFAGLSIVARPGLSIGTLVGTRYLRDGKGQLILRNGHPLPDSLSGPVVLGSALPKWTGGVTSTVRMSYFTASVLVDGRQGGKMFSATNRAGLVSGTFAETAFRPDSGFLITGIDAATSGANLVHVSAEDYYHSLAPITERWIYDASYVKLRELRLTAALPLDFLPNVRAQTVRVSLIGRNLKTWSSVPNVDPESVLSTSNFQGAELGQLPSTRTLGIQFSLTP